MPLPLIVWAIASAAARVAAQAALRAALKKAAQEAAKKVAQEAAKKVAQEAAKKAAQESAKKAAQEAAKKAAAKQAGKKPLGNTKPQKHKGKENKKKLGRCVLRPYKPNTCAPKTGHHVVPDRVFRIGSRTSGKRIPGGPSEADGLVICVQGKNLSKDAEHGQIHAKYDKIEAILGSKGKPPGTASLIELEALGALSVGKVTGCNPALIEAQLRAAHQARGLGPNAQVRADPYGKISQQLDPTKLGTGSTRVGGLGR